MMKRRNFILTVLSAITTSLVGMFVIWQRTKVHVYQVTESDFVAAYSLKQAVKFYEKDTGVDPYDPDEWYDGYNSAPRLVPDEGLVDIPSIDDNDVERTFDRLLDYYLDELHMEAPFHFASSC